MNKEDLKYKINQLRKSKQILATEIIGVNLSVMIGIFLTIYFVENESIRNILLLSGGLFAIAFSLYMSFKNVLKHNEVKKLEKQLWEQ